MLEDAIVPMVTSRPATTVPSRVPLDWIVPHTGGNTSRAPGQSRYSGWSHFKIGTVRTVCMRTKLRPGAAGPDQSQSVHGAFVSFEMNPEFEAVGEERLHH